MSLPLKVSIPKALILTDKFCLPEPTVMRGTFSATREVFSVASITRSGSTATVTLSSPHTYQTGNQITIEGATEEEYNGQKKITVTSSTVFTFSVESTATTPATGTIIATNNNMKAIGVGTFGGGDFQNGDWFYVPSLNELRQASLVNAQLPTVWYFNPPFSADISAGELIRIAPSSVYKGVSVKNTGGMAGVYKEEALNTTDLAESNFDQACLAPVCGDATGTSFKVNLQ